MDIQADRATTALYGQFIEPADQPPAVNDPALRYWPDLFHFDVDGPIEVGLCVTEAREPVVRKLERHLQTPELLVALDGDMLVPVAPPSENGPRDLGGVQLPRNHAFVFGRGVWHGWPLPTTGGTVRYLVIFRRGTLGKDLDVRELPEPVRLELPLREGLA